MSIDFRRICIFFYRLMSFYSKFFGSQKAVLQKLNFVNIKEGNVQSGGLFHFTGTTMIYMDRGEQTDLACYR